VPVFRAQSVAAGIETRHRCLASPLGISPSPTPPETIRWSIDQEVTMSKTGRKRRGRKKKAANHGKRPNA
jgi:hypothetical protein